MIREPLLWFLALGAIVLAIDHGLGPEAHDPRRIDVTEGVIADLDRQLRDGLGRSPTRSETDAAVDRWIRDEMLAREARARGLDRGDPVIRARLAARMGDIFDARAVPDAPDEQALRALYAAHRDDYRVATRLTIRQIFVADAGADPSARGRADALLERARAGEDPRVLLEGSDPPPGGPLLRGRRPARLAEQFGEAFTAGLDAESDMTWTPRRSPAGWHILRIERRQPGRQLSFDEARSRLDARWRRARAAEAGRAAVEALRPLYDVRGWPRGD